MHVRQKLYLDVVAQVICKLAKVLNVSGPCLRLLSQRVSEDLRIWNASLSECVCVGILFHGYLNKMIHFDVTENKML